MNTPLILISHALCPYVQLVATDKRSAHDVTLLEGLGRAFYWQHLLDTGVMKSGSDIARAEGLHASVINELLRLNLLAPTSSGNG